MHPRDCVHVSAHSWPPGDPGSEWAQHQPRSWMPAECPWPSLSYGAVFASRSFSSVSASSSFPGPGPSTTQFLTPTGKGNQFLMDDTELQNLVKELSLHVMAAINDMSCPLYMSVLLCVVYSWSPGWTYTINSTIPLLLDFQVISGPAVCRN